MSAPAEAVVEPAPAFYVSGGAGAFSLEALRGKVVLAEVCAAWSPASRERVNLLNQLYQEGVGQGLYVVGLVVEGAVEEGPDRLATQYPLVHASQAFLRDQGAARAVPSCRLYDRQGKVRKAYDGPAPADELRADVRALLSE